MTDGAKNKVLELTCLHAKQEFGKPHHTGDRFACQTHAFFATRYKDKKDFKFFDNKFLPP